MRFVKTLLGMILWAMLVLPYSIQAAPRLLFYQGRLTDATGDPIISESTVTFTFWDSDTGGSEIGFIMDVDTVTPNPDGTFSTLIGDEVDPLFDSLFADNEILYLNINVNGEDISPRQLIVSSAFAIFANKAFEAFLVDGEDLSSLHNAANLNGTVPFIRLPVGSGPTQVAQGDHTHPPKRKSHLSLEASDGDPTAALFIDSDGNVGIGESHPTHLLHVNGVARSSQSTFDTSSDERVKENVETLENGLEGVLRLRPVRFEWTDEYREENPGIPEGAVNFLAQEVEEVFPEMVREISEKVGDETIDDFRVMNSGMLLPLLVKAIQEQQAMIETLKEKIEKREQPSAGETN